MSVYLDLLVENDEEVDLVEVFAISFNTALWDQASFAFSGTFSAGFSEGSLYMT